jgi:hypothetical protein
MKYHKSKKNRKNKRRTKKYGGDLTLEEKQLLESIPIEERPTMSNLRDFIHKKGIKSPEHFVIRFFNTKFGFLPLPPPPLPPPLPPSEVGEKPIMWVNGRPSYGY